ncbi:hypothetical protein [Kitasatospora phosalacinea]|uniref:hypothetical protein n=1 Tax=Kitasatospora phosalacinea TaxID=2065 RepID=UPI00068EAF02|nr:hypothetical protein [Kitasatospora phosalacinea]
MDSQGDRLRLSSEAPGAPGDIWNLLPRDFRKTVTSLSAERSRQIHDGIAGTKGDWRPLRPMVLDRAHYDQVGRISARLMRLVLDACRRRAGNAGELQDALGVPAEQTPLLDRSAPLEDGLLVAARPDVLYADGVPYFVEFNIDGALGGTLQADLLAERFRDLHRLVPGGERVHAPASAVDARFAEIRTSLALPEGARVAIPVFRQGAAPGLEDAEAFLSWLGPMCDSGRRHGMDTVACTMDRLTNGADDDLLLDGRRVDAVFRLFLAHDQPAGPGLDALVRAVKAGRVAMHTPETTWLLSDKTTMAWLWQDRDQLPDPDRELVERHVPWTALLPAGPEDGAADGTEDDTLRRALARRAELVLKPVGGYGGSGVVLGPETTDEQWRRALLRARREGRHVLQRHVRPDLLALDFADQRTGAVERAEVPFVLGPFMFGGAPSGVLVRHGVPGGGPVLNAHHGAVMSTVLLADRC